MTPWMRRLHKWLGLLIGLQLLLWMASGAGMALLDHERVQGYEFRAHAGAAPPWPRDVLPPAAVLGASVAHSVGSGWLLDTPVYQVALVQGVQLFDARSGAAVRIDAALAAAIARASYTGSGKPLPAQWLSHSAEVRDHDGPMWRIDFADAEQTSVYLSAQSGEVLVHRNRTWRLFDVFWMLHIMDYAERSNFNNPLLIGAGVGGLWIALTGLWLLLASFRLTDFVPRCWRGKQALSVFSTDGQLLRRLAAPTGETVYLALAREGLSLPSNCGGGQSCGLCAVRVRGTPPRPTPADRAQLGALQLKMGFRLACNLPVTSALQVEAAGGANLWQVQTATVERVTAVTPFLREIVLKTERSLPVQFQPGAYLQVHVPSYLVPRERLVCPDEHRHDWAALVLPAALRNPEPVRRSYSLAMPVDAASGRLTLLVRFNPGQQGRRAHAPGRGSSYLYTLRVGDPVRFSGPFGDFAIRPGGREKVFIGGGAGMAPLRTMIHSLLASDARERIHFWYGARSRREAPYVEEMAGLAARHPRFSWHLVLSDQAREDHGDALRGLVHEMAHEHLLRSHPALKDCDFYVCGPPAMLSATRRLLARLGVAEEQVRFDDFKI